MGISLSPFRRLKRSWTWVFQFTHVAGQNGLFKENRGLYVCFKILTFLSCYWKHKGIFSSLPSENMVRLLEAKLWVGSPYDWAPWEFLTLMFVYTELPEVHQLQFKALAQILAAVAGFAPGLLPVSCESLYLAVHLYSFGGNVIGLILSLFSFLLVMTGVSISKLFVSQTGNLNPRFRSVGCRW